MGEGVGFALASLGPHNSPPQAPTGAHKPPAMPRPLLGLRSLAATPADTAVLRRRVGRVQRTPAPAYEQVVWTLRRGVPHFRNECTLTDDWN